MSNQIKISIFTLSSLLICITAFSLTIQDAFGETRQECRSSVVRDQSLTPVERVLALRECSVPDSSIPTFAEIYTEELHNECERRVPHDTWLNHVLRMRDLQECNRLEVPDTTLTKQKITKFSKLMIDFCGEKYEVYQYVGAKGLRNHAGISTPICLELYSAPMWNSTDKDRNIQLHNFLMEITQQSIDKTKKIREKIVEKSRLNRPIISTLEDLFDEQKEKIEYLEKQLQEKNAIIDYFKQDFYSEKLEICSRIYYDEVPLKEKIIALNECWDVERFEPVEINRNKVIEESKKTLQFCVEFYENFSKLNKKKYYEEFLENPLTKLCARLYGDPIWEYNQNDRMQVLESFLHYKIVKNIYEKSHDSKQSAYMAILDQDGNQF